VAEAHWFRVMGGPRSQHDNWPVDDVKYNVGEVCRKLSALPEERADGRVYRLPTEAKWCQSRRLLSLPRPALFVGSPLSGSPESKRLSRCPESVRSRVAGGGEVSAASTLRMPLILLALS